MAAVPVLSDNMSSLTVVYGFPDLHVFGEMVDTIGTSEAFQKCSLKPATRHLRKLELSLQSTKIKLHPAHAHFTA